MTHKGLLDANIVFDLILKRERMPKIRELLANFDELYISTGTFALSFYVLPKSGLSQETIFVYLENYKILPFLEIQCLNAYNLAKKSQDTEDCMELELAKENNLFLITADKEFAANYIYNKFLTI